MSTCQWEFKGWLNYFSNFAYKYWYYAILNKFIACAVVLTSLSVKPGGIFWVESSGFYLKDIHFICRRKRQTFIVIVFLHYVFLRVSISFVALVTTSDLIFSLKSSIIITLLAYFLLRRRKLPYPQSRVHLM